MENCEEDQNDYVRSFIKFWGTEKRVTINWFCPQHSKKRAYMWKTSLLQSDTNSNESWHFTKLWLSYKTYETVVNEKAIRTAQIFIIKMNHNHTKILNQWKNAASWNCFRIIFLDGKTDSHEGGLIDENLSCSQYLNKNSLNYKKHFTVKNHNFAPNYYSLLVLNVSCKKSLR